MCPLFSCSKLFSVSVPFANSLLNGTFCANSFMMAERNGVLVILLDELADNSEIEHVMRTYKFLLNSAHLLSGL